MKRSIKKFEVIIVLLFLGLNIINTYFILTEVLNPFFIGFGNSFFMQINSFFGNLGFLLIVMGLIFFFIKSYRYRAIWLTIISLLLNLLIISILLYCRHYQIPADPTCMEFAKQPKTALSYYVFKQSVYEFFAYHQYICLFPTIILIIYTLITTILTKLEHSINKFKIVLIYKKLSIFLIFFLFGTILCLTTLFSASKKYEKSPLQNNKITYYAQTAGIYNYYATSLLGIDLDNNEHSKDFKIELDEFIKFNKNTSSYSNLLGYKGSNIINDENINPDLFIDPKLKKNTSNINGLLKNKNIILVHLESFNHLFLEENGYLNKDTLPKFKEFCKEAYTLDNFYNNVGIDHSSDAELSINTGIIPHGMNQLYMSYKKGDKKLDFKINPLSKIFNDKNGYENAVLHGDIASFYNRHNVYPNMYEFDRYYHFSNTDKFDDIETLYNAKDYYKEYVKPLTKTATWPADSQLYEWVKRDAKRINDNGNKFFLFAINSYPHTPYPFSIHKPKYNKENINVNKVAIDYLNFLPDYDDIIMSLVDLTKNIPDTVLVAYCDHGCGLGLNDLRKISGKEKAKYLEMWNEYHKTFAFVYYPDPNDINSEIPKGLIKGKQKLVRSQIDIYRSILELFDKTDDNFYYGTSIFSNEKTFAYLAKPNFVVTDEYVASLSKFYTPYPKKNKYLHSFNKTEYDYEDLKKKLDKITRFKYLNDLLVKENIFPFK